MHFWAYFYFVLYSLSTTWIWLLFFSLYYFNITIPHESYSYWTFSLHLPKRTIECLSVCRSWYHMLDKRGLLYELDLWCEQYYRLRESLERFPHRSAQTEYLIFNLPGDHFFDRRELCNVFPNLWELRLKAPDGEQLRPYPSRPFNFTNSTSKLETIEDYDDCEFVLQLSSLNMCNNLKTLELDLSDSNNFSIAQLNSMPVLEYVWITDAHIFLWIWKKCIIIYQQ